MNKNLLIAAFIAWTLAFMHTACTPAVQSTLLSSKQACTLENGCLEDLQTTIPGELSISADNPQMTVNIELSDIVEVSGSCRDLGRRENRILVNVFEGEDESKVPYVDNSANANCSGSTTDGTASGGPNINGQRCFLIGLGNGFIPQGSTAEYPQCYNGRFSFRVRLGKIVKDGASNIINYLIRFKLQTSNPNADSAWSRAIVTRKLSSPAFEVSQTIASSPQLRCEIVTHPFRGANVRYELRKLVTAPAGTPPPTNPIPNIYPGAVPLAPAFPDPDFGFNSGNTVQKFFDDDVIHGVTYTYTMRTTDYKYTPLAPREVSSYSEGVVCKTPTPEPAGLGCSCTAGIFPGANCFVQVNQDSNFRYEWQFSSTDSNWPTTTPAGTGSVACMGSGSRICNFPVAPAAKYFVSLRAEAADGHKGDWMQRTIICEGR